MPTDAAPADELDDGEDEAPAAPYDPDYDLPDDEVSPFMQRAKRLRDGPTWVGLAPIGILVATLIATIFGNVVVILLVLFGGAAAWGVAVWRITRVEPADDPDPEPGELEHDEPVDD
jgi:hypothetical protein